ncbi:MAG: fabG 13 [Candidatus Midichloriaceae bacterium]|jgi:NAD(P)-dependent dehydrogenase (short-subunit alcohol dehydrogenase family)|nr:fabG 13 [Candidatus Midichloriaceae bacterium]
MSKIILITAGAKRIGKELVEHLRKQGHRVLFTYNSTKSEDIDSYQLDLADAKEIEKFWSNLNTKIDVLINNAACFEKDDATSTTINSFQKHMAINLEAPILMTQKFLEQENNGLIINMLDKWADSYPEKFLSYTLSKNGLEAFTCYLNQNYTTQIKAFGIKLGFTLYNEKFPLKFFNDKKSLYPSSVEQLIGLIDIIISSDKISPGVIDL